MQALPDASTRHPDSYRDWYFSQKAVMPKALTERSERQGVAPRPAEARRRRGYKVDCEQVTSPGAQSFIESRCTRKSRPSMRALGVRICHVLHSCLNSRKSMQKPSRFFIKKLETTYIDRVRS